MGKQREQRREKKRPALTEKKVEGRKGRVEGRLWKRVLPRKTSLAKGKYASLGEEEVDPASSCSAGQGGRGRGGKEGRKCSLEAEGPTNGPSDRSPV